MKEVGTELPIKSKGITVVLLKQFGDEYKVLLLRATSVLRDIRCYIGGRIEEGEKVFN